MSAIVKGGEFEKLPKIATAKADDKDCIVPFIENKCEINFCINK